MNEMTEEALRFIKMWDAPGKYIECLTSGSTGNPKKILLPKKEMEKSALRTVEYFGLNEGSHIHSAISLDTIGGRMAWIRAKLCGCKFSCEIPSSNPKFRGASAEGHISLASIVPTQMISILENAKERARIYQNFVDCFLIGGAPLPLAMQAQIEDVGFTAYETYGMTETASHIALRKISREGSSFFPLKGISIFDSNGCLGIEIEGWKRIVTNDEAEILEDGSFRILGRRDNAIITGGKKVHPEKIEKQLFPHLGGQIMVWGEADKKWGSKVVITIENPKDAHIDEGEVLSICRAILEPHEVPKRVIFDKLPRTSNGKLRRKP